MAKHKDTSEPVVGKGAQYRWDEQYGDVYEVNLDALGSVVQPADAPYHLPLDGRILGDYEGARTLAGVKKVHTGRGRTT